ncbi:MAG TPA: HAMP domain-containing sensor histidine kinase [Acidobacteriota bacterium]|nr:HAMP domain-containing sensor histidine kinase [Acidobacteriota bacterium]
MKAKLFLFFGLLIAGVLAFHWWLVNRAARASVEQAGEAALTATREVAEFFDQRIENLLDHLAEGGEVTLVQAQESVQEKVEAGSEGDKEEKERRVVRVLKQPSESHLVSERELVLDGQPGRLSTRVELHDEGSAFSATLKVKGAGFERTISIPSTDVESTVSDLRSRLLGGTVLALLLGLSGAGFIAYGVSRPLGELTRAARRVASGELGLQVADSTGGEVGAALQSFNRMSQRLQEYDRERRRWQQEEQLSELGQIARGFAHTIRNPLNTLGLVIEELASCPPDDPRAQELAATARRQTARIDSWIRSFLSLAADGEGLQEPVEVGVLLEDVVLEAVQHGQAQVSLDLPEEADLTIKGVQAEIRGMVQALAVNAVEAAPQGHIGLAAKVHPEGGVVISVEDDGPGLPPQVRERLFTPHVTTKSQGSGMGLYLASRVAITRYQGSLSIEDRDPHGSRALLHLRHRRRGSVPSGPSQEPNS